MTFQNIVKDIGSIYQRLFDHGPALQGETGYFYSQFEEHPRSKEFDQLLTTSHMINEAIDCEVEERLKSAPLDKINTKLETVAGMLERTVARGQEGRSEYVKCTREEQKADWEKFDAEIERKRKEVDEQYDYRMGEMKKYFDNLQQTPSS